MKNLIWMGFEFKESSAHHLYKMTFRKNTISDAVLFEHQTNLALQEHTFIRREEKSYCWMETLP